MPTADGDYLFHPIVTEWFTRRFTEPTDIQRLAWPRIAAGAHLLVSAPTGTGKTLTVFLMAIDRLIRGESECGATRILYVSPLKALNNDIRENLTQPLSELREMFESRGEVFPDVRVVTRSGDTPQSERQRMLRKPPEILITTPESLNLLLSSPKARSVLATVETVILDEIHAVAAGKRGTHLITAVERLTLLAGEFQRIAVSATVKPLRAVADFVGGYGMEGGARSGAGEGTPDSVGAVYRKRHVEIVQAPQSKKITLDVAYPVAEMTLGEGETVWHRIAESVREIVNAHASTLVFVNSRRLSENMTHIINQDGERIAYAHHGSLSREVRHVVEKKLKAGELSAIVATTSLEMGIDIGKLDQVVLVQTPFSVSSAVQRIGRAGHSVHETSSGVLFPSHGMDLVHAAVMARLVDDKDVEQVAPVRGPLDVLSQVLVSMIGIQSWNVKELYAFIRTCSAYHELEEEAFLSVLHMLAGRYRATRIRELRPRIYLDEVSDTVQAARGALHLIYLSGGTIPDRGYFSMRIHGSQSRVGELDEEFVWERKVGDTFTLGTQSWKITKMDHQKVEVVPWRGPVKIQPFWKGETANRDGHYSEKIGKFLELCDERKDDPGFMLELRERFSLAEGSVEALLAFLSRQKGASGVDLPHRRHIVIEHTVDPSTGGEFEKVFIHTLWGNRVNYPLSLVLAALWEQDHLPAEVMSDNDLVMMQLPGAGASKHGIAELLHSIKIDEIDGLIRKRLEGGGFFGARFRENCGRALLLPRSGVGKRTPLWVNRLKAKRLMASVREYQDFPILVETWRTCIQDEFELDTLKARIQEVVDGEIRVSEVTTEVVSPFAEGSLWQSTNLHLYGDDTPTAGFGSSLDDNLLREAVFSDTLRPEVDPALMSLFERKTQRIEEGYSPESPAELIEWVGERLFVPVVEWEELLLAMSRDHGSDRGDLIAGISDRCLVVRLPGGEVQGIVSVAGLAGLCQAFSVSADTLEGSSLSGDGDVGELLNMTSVLAHSRIAAGEEEFTAEAAISQWLTYYGPVVRNTLSSIFGLEGSDLEDILYVLTEQKSIVVDRLTLGALREEVCDAQNLEKLLAFGRRKRRGSFEPQSIEKLQPFLAYWQRPGRKGKTQEDLKKVLSPLLCFQAAAARWEEDILPARLEGYQSFWLDELLRTTEIEWAGCGDGKITFCFPEDAELFREPRDGGPEIAEIIEDGETVEPGSAPSSVASSEPAAATFPDSIGRYSFWDLRDRSGLSSGAFADTLWNLVWNDEVRCDSFEVVRNGVLRGFKAVETARPADRQRRSTGGLGQWRASRPIAGNWYLAARYEAGDLLDRIDLEKDRVRLLLQRYGILFRELLSHEAKPLRWSALFRTMRLMELAGEIVGGHFFSGVAGIQFATPAALRVLQDRCDEGRIYWINAADPASVCGVDVTKLKSVFPERFPSTYLVMHGSRVAIIARKRGADLTIQVPPEASVLPSYLRALGSLTTRSFNPVRMLKIRTINGVPASESGYDGVLASCGFIKDYQGYTFTAIL